MSHQIPIYIVHTPGAIHRKKHIQRVLKEHKLQATIVEGVRGDDLNAQTFKKKYANRPAQQEKYKLLSIYEIACKLSHKKVLERIVQDGPEYAVVLEDDVTLGEDFEAAISNLHLLPAHWQLCHLGSWSYPPHPFLGFRKYPIAFWKAKRFKFSKASRNYYIGPPMKPLYGAYAYAVSLNGAKQLLANYAETILIHDSFLRVMLPKKYVLIPCIAFALSHRIMSSEIKVRRDASDAHPPGFHPSRIVRLWKRMLFSISYLISFK